MIAERVMKRAFTLIELLVVIAIVTILAAVLFPVFARAKVSAKKTTGISHQKQIGIGFILYAGDSDDIYPRQDDCVPGSSLNPALRNNPGPGDGCTTAPFYNRTNHYSFQKWIMPYVKSAALFLHPGRSLNDLETTSCLRGQWTSCGQITGSFALNLSLTGSLNVYGNPDRANAYRNSFLGGSLGAISRPAETMILLETGNPVLAYAPTAFDDADRANNTVTHYPAAFREIYAHELLEEPGHNCTGLMQDMGGASIDENRVFADGLIIGFTDGHVKFLPVREFLAKTPSVVEYGMPKFDYCGISSGTNAFTNGKPNVGINYPLWGLGD